MKFRNDNMLLYIAMADASCICVEYVDPEGGCHDALIQDALNCYEYLSHPKYSALKKSQYTDDTEMSCANAKVLIYNHIIIPQTFADAWVTEYRRGGKREGYGRGLQSVLNTCKNGTDFLHKINPHSDRNGAAMRAVPFGVVPMISDVLNIATAQACITNNTRAGLFSSRAVALLSHLALYTDIPLNQIGAMCYWELSSIERRMYEHVFFEPWDDRIGRYMRHGVLIPLSVVTVHAVVQLLRSCTSLMDMRRQVIRWGGDTDSVAAIAWGIASCRMQDEVLPVFLARDLENGNSLTGTLYLQSLGTQLMNRF